MYYRIMNDTDPINPRSECKFGTIYYHGGRYVLGDEETDGDHLRNLENDPDYISLPVYAYIHSGIAMNTTGFSCPWDSGQCGVIAVSKNDVRVTFGRKRITKKLIEQVQGILRSEVSEFSKFVNGEVYGFEIIDDNDEVVDSCWGFIGEESCREYAEDTLKYHQKKTA